MVSVGFPLGTLSRWFLGSHSSWQTFVRHGPGAGRPCLLVMGDHDQFTGIDTIRGLVDEAVVAAESQRASGSSPGGPMLPLQLKVVEGGDHFFVGGGMRRNIASIVVSWIKDAEVTLSVSRHC